MSSVWMQPVFIITVQISTLSQTVTTTQVSYRITSLTFSSALTDTTSTEYTSLVFQLTTTVSTPA